MLTDVSPMEAIRQRQGGPFREVNCYFLDGVVLSDRCELNEALVMLRAGADGYVFEQISRDALIKSLDLVMLGVTILPAALMRLIGEEHEMDSKDDPAVPATQTEVPTFNHMPRTL